MICFLQVLIYPFLCHALWSCLGKAQYNYLFILLLWLLLCMLCDLQGTAPLPVHPPSVSAFMAWMESLVSNACLASTATNVKNAPRVTSAGTPTVPSSAWMVTQRRKGEASANATWTLNTDTGPALAVMSVSKGGPCRIVGPVLEVRVLINLIQFNSLCYPQMRN